MMLCHFIVLIVNASLKYNMPNRNPYLIHVSMVLDVSPGDISSLTSLQNKEKLYIRNIQSCTLHKTITNIHT